MGQMTLAEKVAQLYGVWVGIDSGGEEWRRTSTSSPRCRCAWDELIRDGLGQLTRPFGTAPGRPGRRRPRSARRPSAEIVAAEPVRHPRAGARGVPDRARRLAGHGLPVAAVLGRELRPGAGRADGRADRRHHARASASTRASPRCSTSPATCAGAGSRRRSARTRYLVGTIGSAYVRGVQSAGVDRHPQALRRLLRLARRPQPRPGLGRAARARRRAAAAVRDGAARRGRLGDELLHRHRRRARRGRPDAAHRPAARHLRLHRHRRRRLLLRRLPADPARRRRRPPATRPGWR